MMVCALAGTAAHSNKEANANKQREGRVKIVSCGRAVELVIVLSRPRSTETLSHELPSGTVLRILQTERAHEGGQQQHQAPFQDDPPLQLKPSCPL
jgi:hypothetical protein